MKVCICKCIEPFLTTSALHYQYNNFTYTIHKIHICSPISSFTYRTSSQGGSCANLMYILATSSGFCRFRGFMAFFRKQLCGQKQIESELPQTFHHQYYCYYYCNHTRIKLHQTGSIIILNLVSYFSGILTPLIYLACMQVLDA
jgi:hypothetical protein